MKNINFKKLLPHLVAVAVFLLVTVIFCKPALEPNTILQQGDITASDAMKHQGYQYREEHGSFPLWITNMFGGMPSYQLMYDVPLDPPYYIDRLLQLWLPKPLNFFFLSCISFYILAQCLRIRPYVSILGSLAFAYCTYDPIIAVAGHDTKFLALAYVPALIGAVILIFDKKYISGFVLTALFTGLHLAQNHQQVSYYALIIIGVMAIFYLIRWIKNKESKHIIKVLYIAVGAAVIGILVNALSIFPIYDYAKESKRGGQLVLDESNNATNNSKTSGLSKDYAFQWSYGKSEAMSLLFPGVMGYGSASAQRDGESSIFPELGEKSHVVDYLTTKLNLPENQATDIASSISGAIYWGDQPFTMGPVYLGASIFFLFILGLFLLDGRHKWWILTASIIAITLALGKNLPDINYFLFDHLPFYNRFRTPSMALVIPQVLFPLMAILTIEALIDGAYSNGWKKLKQSAIITGILFAIAGMMYISFDYSKENKQRTAAINNAFVTQDNTLGNRLQQINAKYDGLIDNQLYENFLYQSKGDTEVARGIVNAVRKDRASFFGNDILRSLLFVALTIVLIALYLSKRINTTILVIGLPLLTLIDLLPLDAHYLSDKNFENSDKYEESQFSQTSADKKILTDTDPNFRVFNISGGDPFQDARTSYYHKSIGGYHPAKLGIYDDLITYQLSGSPNPAVINMLNTKYFIEKTPDGKDVMAVQNPGALGNCWFVKGIKYEPGAVGEMKALNNFNPRDTAIVNDSYKDQLKEVTTSDSSAIIKQTAFNNMYIKYESHSSGTYLAVFSEIFYKDWKAYIDGRSVPIVKADYVLRALPIPSGNHVIEFKFESKVFNISYRIEQVFLLLLTALLLVYVWYLWKTEMK